LDFVDKCLQTRNLFGYPTVCYGYSWQHNSSTIPILRCAAEPQECHHHTPIYDEFALWADEVRNELKARG
jgi:hypothetical protein